MANLYEEGDDIEKVLQFALLAAQLAPPDPDEWSRLADMSLEQGDIKQACICYKKAIEADPTNSKFYFTRCNLLEQIGDKKASLRCYRKMLLHMQEDQGEEFLQGAREAARLLHERGQVHAAQQVFGEVFTKFPAVVTDQETNLYLELLLLEESYQVALEVCCQHCSVTFNCHNSEINVENLEPEDQLATFTDLVVPDELAADIKCKIIIILLQLKAKHLADNLLEMFLEAEANDFGDFMLDIVEALMKNKHYPSALEFLEKLVNSDR